jgi:hypothetical protein
MLRGKDYGRSSTERILLGTFQIKKPQLEQLGVSKVILMDTAN